MEALVKKIKENKILLSLLLVYFIISISYLTRFPFVHSDESWLSGLSRNIMEKGDYSVTETFFDLYPRYPHAIKAIFHTIQILFIKIFGYRIFSVRFMSLIFSMFIIYFFYKLSRNILKDSKIAFISLVLLVSDIQFIYASHFARQEIVILFALIVGLYFFYTHRKGHKIKDDIVLGGIVGLSIGIHPNSFIISICFGLIYVYSIFINKDIKIKNLVVYVTIVSIFAGIFVLISLSFNSNFFQDYFNYGKEFGVDYSLLDKISGAKYFYYKLYHSIGGTYYLPNIKLQFWIFGAVFITAIFKLAYKRDKYYIEVIPPVMLAIVAINIGIILIGRYNQTSIVFQFPVFYLLLAYVVGGLKKNYKYIFMGLLWVAIIINSVLNIKPYLDNSYSKYLKEVSKVVKKDDVVLANLNLEFYFDNGKLHDYRNLAFLENNNISFKDYIIKNNIKYIIYPEEMDMIYKEQPRWDGLYGKLNYYEDMQIFLKNKCELKYELRDKTYGNRIARYVNDKEWKIKIYKVK